MFNTPGTDKVKDTQELSSAIYHKVQNEVSLLKIIARQATEKAPTVEVLPEALARITEISDWMVGKREVERGQVEQLAKDNYEAIMKVVSATAHDVVDYVSNELPALKNRVRRRTRNLTLEAPALHQVEKLLAQIDYTMESLNDLKSFNESFTFSRSYFNVADLFTVWQLNPKLDNATVSLDIQNGESSFNGDEQKIKGFLSELIGNALKHNAKQPELHIQLTSRDVMGLPEHLAGKVRRRRSTLVLGSRKYLALTVEDTGQGIPASRKEWIFLPFKSTTKEGSGLGLFIIKRNLALEEMQGYIVETGTKGAKFEIYLPYGENQ